MAKYLRYKGEFLSRASVVWRVEILQESAQAYSSVGDLDFDADDALEIDWGQNPKEQVICGSTATVRIISPGDRTYEDLYTITPGAIRMDVYRNNALYWSGAMDPEFYEEPYEQASGYVVALTFSDFGILDRLKYDLAGMQSVYAVVQHSIAKSGMNTAIDRNHISTRLTKDGVKLDLTELLVRSDNFFDEDGEALSLKEVLEGVLQPLALKIIQRAGKVYVYDLNALYAVESQEEAYWTSDSQTMGADKVYNNVKITWSPYVQKDSMGSKECWDMPTDPNLTALRKPNGLEHGDATLFSYFVSPDPIDWKDTSAAGFTIWLSEKGKNAEILDERARYFKIVPQFDGSESEGVALKWTGAQLLGIQNSNDPEEHISYVKPIYHGLSAPEIFMNGTASANPPVFRMPAITIAPADEPEKLAMSVKMDVMVSYKFNPFEDIGDKVALGEPSLVPNWHIKWEENWKYFGNLLYVPVAIKFQPEGSTDIYRWCNQNVLDTDINVSPLLRLSQTYGHWLKEVNGNTSEMGWLCYYNVDDREESTPVGTWATNRPAINPYTIPGMEYALKKADCGQIIPYPPVGQTGGKMWIEVLSGSWLAAKGGHNMLALWEHNLALPGESTWVLCQLPEIKILNNTWFARELESEDVEYSAEINADAKDDLELDTICGTSADGVPAARGAYFSASDGRQVKTLSRAGRTSQAEDLLIGTLFSQYGQRHTTLSGEMSIASGGLTTYTEANQEGKRFLLSGDVQNVIQDTSDATLIELRPDEYNRTNE